MIQRLNCCHCFCFHRLTATVYQRTSRIRVVADFNHGVTELRQRRRSVSVSRAASQHRRRRDAATLSPLRVYTFDLSSGVHTSYRISCLGLSCLAEKFNLLQRERESLQCHFSRKRYAYEKYVYEKWRFEIFSS